MQSVTSEKEGTISIHVDALPQPRGSSMEGRIVLTGGTYPQYIERVIVALSETSRETFTEMWLGSRTPGCNHLARFTLDEGFELLPDATKTFAFALDVPDLASDQPRLMAWAVAAHGKYPQVEYVLELCANDAIVLIHEVMENLGFAAKALPEYQAVRDGEWSASYTAHYAPPQHLQAEVEEIKLHLKCKGAGWKGFLEVNHAERTAADHIRAVMALDRVASHFFFAHSDLYDDEGEPREEQIAAILSLAFKRAVRTPHTFFVRSNALRKKSRLLS